MPRHRSSAYHRYDHSTHISFLMSYNESKYTYQFPQPPQQSYRRHTSRQNSHQCLSTWIQPLLRWLVVHISHLIVKSCQSSFVQLVLRFTTIDSFRWWPHFFWNITVDISIKSSSLRYEFRFSPFTFAFTLRTISPLGCFFRIESKTASNCRYFNKTCSFCSFVLAFERLQILLFITNLSTFEFVIFLSSPIAIIAFSLSLKTMSFKEYESKSLRQETDLRVETASLEEDSTCEKEISGCKR